MSGDSSETEQEVGPRSLLFLRVITVATVVVVLFFIVDAILA